MDLVTTLVIPALVGVAIGVLSGLLGIGGGTIMVPVFRLAFSMSPVMSTATSLFTIIPTSIAGAVSHIRHKTCLPSLGVAAGLGGACTSPIGVWLAQISPAWAVMAAAALIIAYSAVNMLIKAVKLSPTARPEKQVDAAASDRTPACSSRAPMQSAHDRVTGKSQMRQDSPLTGEDVRDEPPASFAKPTRKQLLIGAAIGLGAGLASGYVGVGGGFIMVPLMLSLVGISMKQASGTSLIAVMILAIPGVIEQGILGNINYLAGGAVAIGSIPGALVGARLVRYVPERTLRFIFGGFLIVAAVVLVLNEVGVLG